MSDVGAHGSVVPAGHDEPRTVWQVPAWRYAFPASVISRLGDLVFDLTVVLWITVDIAAGRSWAPIAVSGVLIAAVAPVLVAGPLAGAIVDRTDRHVLLTRSNLVQAVSIGSLLLIPLLGDSLGIAWTLVWIYAAIVVSNAAGQFFVQARLAMIARTIPTELQTKAFSLQGAANSILTLIGPPLAAPLLFTLGVGWALGVNAASFLVSSMLLSRISWDSAPDASAARQRLLESLRDGARAIAANRVLLAITLSLTVVTLATGAITVLEVFFVTDVLRVRADLLGILMLAFAGGTLVGTLIAPRLEARIPAPQLYVWGLVLLGVGIVTWSRTTDFRLAMVVYFAVGLPLGVVNTVLTPLAIRSIPPEQLGRSSAALNIFPTVANLLAMAMAGWLVATVMADLDVDLGVTTVGPVDGVFLVGGLLILLSGIAVAGPIARDAPAKTSAGTPAEPEPDHAASAADGST